MGVRLCAKVDVGWRYSVIRPSNYTVLRLRPVSLPHGGRACRSNRVAEKVHTWMRRGRRDRNVTSVPCKLYLQTLGFFVWKVLGWVLERIERTILGLEFRGRRTRWIRTSDSKSDAN